MNWWTFNFLIESNFPIVQESMQVIPKKVIPKKIYDISLFTSCFNRFKRCIAISQEYVLACRK